MFVALPLLAGLIAVVMTGCLLRWRRRLPLAMPNARSLHQRPVPRVGGLAIWAGWLPVALIEAAPDSLAAWLLPWTVLVLVSLRDDFRSVPVVPRLLAHAFAGLWFAAWLVADAHAGWLAGAGAAVAIVAIVGWALNLYNFMDGSDGLAALMAVIGFTAYGVAAQHAGSPPVLFYALACATLPVLLVNWPPARIFIGDVGAVPLGFLAAAFGVAGVLDGTWAWWFPTLVFLPFIADATVTLGRRALRREPVWEAHKTHYYQRLLQLGGGHRGTLAVYGALMAGTASTAVVCAVFAPRLGAEALAAWCAVCAILFAAIDYHWRKNTTATP
jgi:UDP-GlcNAc:undecaprenyl-phosphate GlcNAc-1-phosphate transferase